MGRDAADFAHWHACHDCWCLIRQIVSPLDEGDSDRVNSDISLRQTPPGSCSDGGFIRDSLSCEHAFSHPDVGDCFGTQALQGNERNTQEIVVSVLIE